MILNKRYLGAASFMLQEIFESVTTEDKKRMKEAFSHFTKNKINQFIQENEKELLSFIKAKPEERATNPKWNDPDYRLKLIYLSFQIVQRGYLLMNRLANTPKYNGTRVTIAYFSMLANDICNKKFKDSIFKDALTYSDYN